MSIDLINMNFDDMVLADSELQAIEQIIASFAEVTKLDELENICNLYTRTDIFDTNYIKGSIIARTIKEHIIKIRDILGIESNAVLPINSDECCQNRRQELIRKLVHISEDGKQSLYLLDLNDTDYKLRRYANSAFSEFEPYWSVADSLSEIARMIVCHWLTSPQCVFVLNVGEI